MALGRGCELESGCQVLAAVVGRNPWEAGAKRAVLEPRLEPRLQTGLRLRECNIRTEAGEDLQPADRAVEEIVFVEVRVRAHRRRHPESRHGAYVDAAEARGSHADHRHGMIADQGLAADDIGSPAD